MFRILLVDDYKPNLRLLEVIFDGSDFSHRSASSVKEAETMLANEPFDLVLSDIQMPGESGFDLLCWIQQQGMKDLPVLFITSAMPEAEYRIQGLSLGAVDYVLRSLDPDELVLRVRKAIENVRELRKLKVSLEDSEKLASLGRIIAASNHEVKNLAHIVRMSAEAIARQGQERDEEKMILLNAANMLADVTRSMNSLLKDEPQQRQTIDAGELVRQMIFMSKTVLKGISILASFDAKKPYWASASPVALKQVLLNLILNAKDSVQEAGNPGGMITVSLHSENSRLRIDVSDTGVGLSSALTQTEFPAFASTKQLRGGTGLGLWFSSRLLKGMGGQLILKSNGPGTGATATIWLDEAPPPPAKIDLSRYLNEL